MPRFRPGHSVCPGPRRYAGSRPCGHHRSAGCHSTRQGTPLGPGHRTGVRAPSGVPCGCQPAVPCGGPSHDLTGCSPFPPLAPNHPKEPITFDLLTPTFDGAIPSMVKVAEELKRQTHSHWTWLLCSNGESPALRAFVAAPGIPGSSSSRRPGGVPVPAHASGEHLRAAGSLHARARLPPGSEAQSVPLALSSTR